MANKTAFNGTCDQCVFFSGKKILVFEFAHQSPSARGSTRNFVFIIKNRQSYLWWLWFSCTLLQFFNPAYDLLHLYEGVFFFMLKITKRRISIWKLEVRKQNSEQNSESRLTYWVYCFHKPKLPTPPNFISHIFFSVTIPSS